MKTVHSENSLPNSIVQLQHDPAHWELFTTSILQYDRNYVSATYARRLTCMKAETVQSEEMKQWYYVGVSRKLQIGWIKHASEQVSFIWLPW